MENLRQEIMKETPPTTKLEVSPDAAQRLQQVQTRLKKLGFKAAAANMDTAAKLAVAYDEYQFIEQSAVNAFNAKLREDTLREDSRARDYKKMIFVALDKYGEVPPPTVLDKLENAMSKGIFDNFEIAKIDWVHEMKDPIIFGRINGSDDRFYIAQWDDDVRIEDIIFCDTERAEK